MSRKVSIREIFEMDHSKINSVLKDLSYKRYINEDEENGENYDRLLLCDFLAENNILKESDIELLNNSDYRKALYSINSVQSIDSLRSVPQIYPKPKYPMTEDEQLSVDVDLFFAVSAKDLNNVMNLIYDGANPNYKDQNLENSALNIAFENGYNEIFDFLLKNGGDPFIDNPNLLVRSVKDNNLSAIKSIYNSIDDKNLFINYRDVNGETLLFLSMMTGDTLDYLLQLGLDINAKNNLGQTSLIKHRKNVAFVKLLSSKGADIDIKDNTGKSVLDYVLDGEKNQDNEIILNLLLNNL